MRTPDFIGIGAPRCGTTWLFEMLKSHPEIDLPDQKALNFFNEYYSHGKDWYLRQFENLSGKAIGEISPLYFANDELARRMKEVVPNAKLILIARDPIDRLKSAHKLINTLRGKEVSLEERIRQSPALLEQGLYYKWTKDILKYFDEDQLLVLSFKEISNDPESAYCKVLTYLGVDSSFMPKRLSEKIGYNIEPKNKTIEKLRQKMYRLLVGNGMAKLIWLFKKTGIAGWLRKTNNQKSSHNIKEDSSALNKYLEFYREDVQAFEKYFRLSITERTY